jgi:DNA-binding transcriptional LysR family regulator
MMKTIIALSDTVGLLTLSVIQAELELGTLALLPVVEPWLDVQPAIVRLAHRTLSPLGKRFVQYVLETDADLVKLEREIAPTLFKRAKYRALE